ncbi:MAG: hypothetical protein DWG82_00910 [Chloroflexi bacterium]|nr:hypothetical protein [Chloroflexota bacterium]
MAAVLSVAAAEQRSMLFVAAPRMAGKTTTMNAALEHRPSGIPVYPLARSAGPDLGIPAGVGEGYLRLAEIAQTGFDDYFWGDEVKQVFAALDRGYSLVTALHADSLEDALAVLDANRVPDEAQSRLDLVCVIRVIGHWEAPSRRAVAALHELELVERGEVHARLLHRWDEASDHFEPVQPPVFVGSVVGDLASRATEFRSA